MIANPIRYLPLFAMLAAVSLCLAIPCQADAVRDYKRTGVTITGSSLWKPYTFVGADGEPAGFFVDFWEKWSEKTGVPVTFRLGKWDESIKSVASGESDMQSGLYFNEERNEIFAFSQPVFHSKAILVVGKDTTCTQDLSYATWGGVKGTEERQYVVDNYPTAEVLAFDDSRKLFEALSSTRIQALVDDWSTVLQLGREMGLDEPISICETVYKRELFAIVQKQNTELLLLVNDGMARITEDEKRFLINKWFIEQDDESHLDRYILPGIVIVLLIALGVYLSYRLPRSRRYNW